MRAITKRDSNAASVQQPCSSAEALGLKQWALERREEGDEVIVRHGNRDKYGLVL
jgi:hypothetical protein